MAITIRTLLPTSLLVVLAACTFDLVPALPQDDPMPEENPAEDAAPGSNTDVFITWTAVADAPLARFEGQSAVVSGNLYVFGGYTDGSVMPKSFEADVYDPASDTWKCLPDMPRPITHAGTTAHGTNIYLAGGVVGSKDPEQLEKTSATPEVWRFNTQTLEWSPMPLCLSLAVLARSLSWITPCTFLEARAWIGSRRWVTTGRCSLMAAARGIP